MATDKTLGEPGLAGLELFPAPLIQAASELIDDLRAKRASLATAESCTGGLLGGLLTAVPGASDVFGYGLVTYSNDAKINLLGVTPQVLQTYGAVSPEVAAAMATGAMQRSGATMAIATTGIAGPGGGTTAKPVGLVYLGLTSVKTTPQTFELRLGAIGRAAIRLETIEQAVLRLRAACQTLS